MISNYTQALEERNANKNRKIVGQHELETKKQEYISFLKKQIENNQTIKQSELHDTHPLERQVNGRRGERGICTMKKQIYLFITTRYLSMYFKR